MDDAIPLRRGLVLIALREQHPLTLSPATLERATREAYLLDPAELTTDLMYLESKGMIKIISKRIGGVPLRSFGLTTRGIDLVDGSIVDSGVRVER